MATLAPSAARASRGRQADAVGGARDQDMLAVHAVLQAMRWRYAAFHLMEQPTDGTCSGGRLAGRDGAHGLDQLATRGRGYRCGAALVEAAAIPELALLVVAEEIRRADRAVGPRHRLVLVVQVRKRETVRLGEALHVGEGVLRIGLRIVGADRREADTLSHQHLGIASPAGR